MAQTQINLSPLTFFKVSSKRILTHKEILKEKVKWFIKNNYSESYIEAFLLSQHYNIKELKEINFYKI
jgi:hypothetical protein